MSNVSGSSALMARLLARENIEIVSGNYKTAFFHLKDRVLAIPEWGTLEKTIQDLFIGHEIGHALYSPPEGFHDAVLSKTVPKSYINVVEDIRIEKKILEKYPGLSPIFKKGYLLLNERNSFGLKGKNVNSLSFMNRLNIKSKLRDGIEIDFNDEEMHYFNLALSVDTWEDVLSVCNELLDFVKRSKGNPKEKISLKSKMVMDENGKVSDEFHQINRSENTSDEEKSDDSFYFDDLEEETSDAQFDDDQSDDQSDDDSDSDLDDIESIFTDDNFRKNEAELSQYDPGIYQLNGFNRSNFQKILIDFEKLKKGRDKVKSIYSEELKNFNNDDQFNEFFGKAKKLVDLMAKEFEMKKAASRYSRSSVSKTGKLDPLKICNYKFSDDIFKSISEIKDSKNHGMVILVDYSYSMTGVMDKVIKQILILSTFCKKTGIPFEVYGFTSSNLSHKIEENIINHVSPNGIRLFNLLSSSFKNADYSLAFRHLFNQSDHKDAILLPGKLFFSSYEYLGGTPLNEVLTGIPFILEKFIAKNKTEKNIFTLITDGESRRISKKSRMHLRMNDGFVIKATHHDITEKLILRIKEMFNLTTLGYFIPLPSDKKETKNKLISSIKREKKSNDTALVNNQLITKKREMNLNKFTSFDNIYGFNKYFILSPAMEGFDIDGNEFSATEEFKISQVRKAFIKYNHSKKANKVFASQFSSIIS